MTNYHLHALINKVGIPRFALLTLVSYMASHAFHNQDKDYYGNPLQVVGRSHLLMNVNVIWDFLLTQLQHQDSLKCNIIKVLEKPWTLPIWFIEMCLVVQQHKNNGL
jgi:hypothetical protein